MTPYEEAEKPMTDDNQELFEDFYYNKIGMCGCGSPSDVKEFIYKLLKNHNDHREGFIEYDLMDKTRKQVITETDPDTIFEFVFHVLENAGIIEHGSSVYSSWLTDEGETFLKLLEDSEVNNL